MEKDKF